MRVLITNTLYYPAFLGGAEKSVQHLAESLILNNSSIEVHVICTYKKDDFKIINGVQVHYLKSGNLYWVADAQYVSKIKKVIWHLLDSFNPIIFLKFAKKIKEISPDIIHTNNLSGFSVSVWLVAYRRNIPIIHTIRDYYLSCIKTTRFKGNKICEKPCLPCRCLSKPKKILSKKVSTVVGISRFILKQHFSESFFKNAKQKEIIYNAVPNIHIAKTKNLQKSRTIGYIGRLERAKGVELLLESFSLITHPDANLCLAGVGTNIYISKIKESYPNQRIKLLGKVNPDEFYKNIDLLVVPSIWNEPFGRVIIEALQYGVPVLANKVGGISEIAKECLGVTLFDGNVESLRDHINNWLNQPKKIKIDIPEQFTQESISKEYFKLYESLQEPAN